MKHKIKKMVLLAVILAILASSQAVFAAPLHPALGSGPVSNLLYDNFDDNFTDPALWSVGQTGGPTITEMNQRLEITLPANSSGEKFDASYYSACLLHGDFDMQVDYALLTWPSRNGVRISLGTTYGNTERVSFGASGDFAGGPEVYLTDFAGTVKGITSTSDSSGKLRLQRVGDTITGYRLSAGGWTVVASNSGPTYTEDTGFGLAAWSHDPVFADQEVKLAFDNLVINSGDLICPSAPAPDLAITQVADHDTVSIGDPVGFTITITNNGDATANIVQLSDTLPIAVGLNWSVSGTDAAACLLTGGALSCNFGDILPGAGKTIRLTSPTQYLLGKGFCQLVSSNATVMAYNQPVNRNATATTDVLCPNAYIEVWADNEITPAGTPISFNARFGNKGEGSARDLLAEITLPTNPGLSWSVTSITPAEAADHCAYGYDNFGTYEFICSYNQIPAGEEVNITLSSPTTSNSCGFINSVGYLTLTNGDWVLSEMKPPLIPCPVGDTTPPVVEPFIAGTQGANGWYTGNVSLLWNYYDHESQIYNLTGCMITTVTQDQAAIEYACSVSSEGGTTIVSATIKRDATQPVTTVTGVAEGAVYTLGSVPQAGCSSTDNLSSMATEATLALTGGDAQGLGSITATCSGALDSAGNAANPAVVHYTVSRPSNTFNFTGFFQPVDNWPTENTMKAGASVPFRFSLGGDMGVNVISSGYPTSRQVSCPTSSVVTADVIEETTTSNSGLTYDAASGLYIYVWKTNKTWGGTCRVFTIQFTDGSSQQAMFKFNK